MANFIVTEMLDGKEVTRYEVLYTSPFGAKKTATSKQAYKFNTSSLHVCQTYGGNGMWFKSQKTDWKWVVEHSKQEVEKCK